MSEISEQDREKILDRAFLASLKSSLRQNNSQQSGNLTEANLVRQLVIARRPEYYRIKQKYGLTTDKVKEWLENSLNVNDLIP